ncbi:MAG: hypothetical protein P2A85_05030 [Microcoleus anatoxicus]
MAIFMGNTRRSSAIALFFGIESKMNTEGIEKLACIHPEIAN